MRNQLDRYQQISVKVGTILLLHALSEEKTAREEELIAWKVDGVAVEKRQCFKASEI